MYRFEAVAVDEAAIAASAALLRASFGDASRFTPDYLSWQYAENPAGTVLGFNAIDGAAGTIAAHYVCQPFDAEIDGARRRGLLSLNTATRPEHQGRGLFTELASRTYDAARSAGYDFVIGVANGNSTPGFVRKLGFHLISPLHALVGIGPLRLTDARPPTYRRLWDENTLRWRLGNPHAPYRTRNGGVWASARRPFIDALIARAPHTLGERSRAIAPVHLWLGLDPRVDARRNPFYVDMPARMRPSPLNLIYLDLRDSARALDPDEIEFWAIDFDAY